MVEEFEFNPKSHAHQVISLKINHYSYQQNYAKNLRIHSLLIAVFLRTKKVNVNSYSPKPTLEMGDCI